MMRLGRGILSWSSTERRTGRYGFVFLSTEDFERTASAEVEVDQGTLEQLTGKRVRLVAQVREARPSGHVGDGHWNVRPEQPAVGERIDLGVGRLEAEPLDFADPSVPVAVQFGVHPSEPRPYLLMDPLALYRLHDQTVELFAEVTEEPDSPVSTLLDAGTPEPGVRAEEDEKGGYYQVFGEEYLEGIVMAPSVTDLGGGAFVVERPSFRPGARVNAQPLRTQQNEGEHDG